MLVRGAGPIGCCGQELKRSLEDLGDHKPPRSTRDCQFASQIITAKRDLARSGSIRSGDLGGALRMSRTRSNGIRSAGQRNREKWPTPTSHRLVKPLQWAGFRSRGRRQDRDDVATIFRCQSRRLNGRDQESGRRGRGPRVQHGRGNRERDRSGQSPRLPWGLQEISGAAAATRSPEPTPRAGDQFKRRGMAQKGAEFHAKHSTILVDRELTPFGMGCSFPAAICAKKVANRPVSERNSRQRLNTSPILLPVLGPRSVGGGS
jgi:hypothetical protein